LLYELPNLNGEDERVSSWDANQQYIFMRKVIKRKKRLEKGIKKIRGPFVNDYQ